MADRIPNGLGNSDGEASTPRQAGATSSERRGPSSDEVSRALGEKMLQGWTLLGDVCPRCSTILVRNRDRELYCVGCEAFVRTAPEPTALPAAEDPTAATMDHAERHPAAEPIDHAQPQQQQLQQERQRGMSMQGQDLQQRQEKVAAQVCNTLLDKVLELEQRISQVHGEGCEHLLSQLRSTLKTYQLLQDSFMRRRA